MALCDACKLLSNSDSFRDQEVAMQEQQEHRGFVITVSTQDHRAGGSTVTLLIERPLKGGDAHQAPPVPKPERYRSPHSGPAAVGGAMDRAKRAIDDALGPRNPFGD
jgi:hypothetical protein